MTMVTSMQMMIMMMTNLTMKTTCDEDVSESDSTIMTMPILKMEDDEQHL